MYAGLFEQLYDFTAPDDNLMISLPHKLTIFTQICLYVVCSIG